MPGRISSDVAVSMPPATEIAYIDRNHTFTIIPPDYWGPAYISVEIHDTFPGQQDGIVRGLGFTYYSALPENITYHLNFNNALIANGGSHTLFWVPLTVMSNGSLAYTFEDYQNILNNLNNYFIIYLII